MPQLSARTNSPNKQHPASSTGRHEHQSIMRVRSFSAFEKDDSDADDEGNGEDVHDILRGRSSLATSVAEAVASPVTFRRIWAETAGLTLAEGQHGRSGSCNSTQSNPERGRARLITAVASGDPQLAETRSPSSHNRSSLSQSTKPKEDSSSSSPGPVDGNVLHGLQSKGSIEHHGLEPLTEDEVDPASFNLVSPCDGSITQYSLETRSEMLFSKEHLEIISDDPRLLEKFTNFLYAFRPKSAPLLVYYVDARKALRAIKYANAVTQSLVPVKGLELGEGEVSIVTNGSLLQKANRALEILAREDLPAYLTHTWIQTMRIIAKKQIMGTLPDSLKDLPEGLGEAFCLTDPSRTDNPIVFASKGFHMLTQYGMNHALGRNSRFLQGPCTSSSSVRRLRESLDAGKEHCEIFLNYRRDGSPFMNLLMVAPLIDSHGDIRYHIGAQVDVSGLVKDCAGLESLKRLVAQKDDSSVHEDGGEAPTRRNPRDEFRELAEMFSAEELITVRELGSTAHRTGGEEARDAGVSTSQLKPRPLSMNDAAPGRRASDPVFKISSSSVGRLGGVYENYLLVRPCPNLRVLFASPSLRFPGMLQSEFMSRIGGAQALRDEIAQAFADGRRVTVKVRWVTKRDSYGKGRWIHTTPLFGSNGAVGVWMVVLIDDDEEAVPRRARDAPPVDSNVGKRRPFDEEGPSSVAGPPNAGKPLEKA
ncbi:hypothetical protein F5Y05DRAFT_253637 [Hypoxylon sp. FL0543]|nr:hypothetical protein F5Y05DRAFT_253637 [Hypoxylon sp. FL0543]